jgi:hypothetical protein
LFSLKLTAIAVIATAALGAGGSLYGYAKGKQAGSEKVQAMWDAEKLAIAQAVADELVRVRQKEQDLQKRIQKIQQEKTDEIARLNKRHARIVDGLRDRPEAPPNRAGVPDPAAAAAPGGWCTGARLYRDHAAAFAGEASLAARLQSELKSCRTQYEAARKLSEKSD